MEPAGTFQLLQTQADQRTVERSDPQEEYSPQEESSDYTDEDIPTRGHGGKTRRRRRRPPWTWLEEAILAKQHAIKGNSWSAIAEHLPGRTAAEVKNIWHSTLRSKKLKARSLLRAYARLVHERGDSASARQEAFRAAVKVAREEEDGLQEEKLLLPPSDDEEFANLAAAPALQRAGSENGADSVTSTPSAAEHQAAEGARQRDGARGRAPGSLDSAAAARRAAKPLPAQHGDAAAAVDAAAWALMPLPQQQHRGGSNGGGGNDPGSRREEQMALLGPPEEAGVGAGPASGADAPRGSGAGVDDSMGPPQSAPRARAGRSKPSAPEPPPAQKPTRVSKRQQERVRHRQRPRPKNGEEDAENDEGPGEQEEPEDDEVGGDARMHDPLRSQVGHEGAAMQLAELQQLLYLQGAQDLRQHQQQQAAAFDAMLQQSRARRMLEEDTQAEAYRFLLRQHLLQRAQELDAGRPANADDAEEDEKALGTSDGARLPSDGRGRAKAPERPAQARGRGGPSVQSKGAREPGSKDGLDPSAIGAGAGLLPTLGNAGLSRDFLGTQLAGLDSLGPMAATLGMLPGGGLPGSALGGAGLAGIGLAGLGLPAATFGGAGFPGMGLGGDLGLNPLAAGALAAVPGLEVLDKLSALLSRLTNERVMNERLAAAAAAQAAAAQIAAAQAAAMRAAAAQAAAAQAAAVQAAAAQAAAMQVAEALRLAGFHPGAMETALTGVPGPLNADPLAALNLLPGLDGRLFTGGDVKLQMSERGAGGALSAAAAERVGVKRPRPETRQDGSATGRALATKRENLRDEPPGRGLAAHGARRGHVQEAGGRGGAWHAADDDWEEAAEAGDEVEEADEEDPQGEVDEDEQEEEEEEAYERQRAVRARGGPGPARRSGFGLTASDPLNRRGFAAMDGAAGDGVSFHGPPAGQYRWEPPTRPPQPQQPRRPPQSQFQQQPAPPRQQQRQQQQLGRRESAAGDLEMAMGDVASALLAFSQSQRGPLDPLLPDGLGGYLPQGVMGMDLPAQAGMAVGTGSKPSSRKAQVR